MNVPVPPVDGFVEQRTPRATARTGAGGGRTREHHTVDGTIAELFHAHADALVRLARLFGDHRDAAEDIVQEAFIRMARSLPNITDASKQAAYLRSIVLNLARDHNRRGLVSLRHQQRHADLDTRGVDEEVADHDDHRRVVAVLRQLPRRQRDALSLHYLLELTVQEIAEAMNLSPNSVKTHLSRGLRALRAAPELDDLFEEES